MQNNERTDFVAWLNTFRTSISDYKYYVNFKKVYANVEQIKIELNILNSLIGSKDIEQDFLNILGKYPETLKAIPTLLAVRQGEILAGDEEGEFHYNFNKPNVSNTQYATFMRKTGLFNCQARSCAIFATLKFAGFLNDDISSLINDISEMKKLYPMSSKSSVQGTLDGF